MGSSLETLVFRVPHRWGFAMDKTVACHDEMHRISTPRLELCVIYDPEALYSCLAEVVSLVVQMLGLRWLKSTYGGFMFSPVFFRGWLVDPCGDIAPAEGGVMRICCAKTEVND